MAIGSDGARATGSMTLTMPGNNGQERKNRGAALLAAARDEYAAEARKGRGGLDVGRTPRRSDGRPGPHALRLREEPDRLPIRRLRPRRLRPSRPLPPLRPRSPDRLRRRDRRRRRAFIKAVFQPLWDLRLSLGQHVRELDDLATPDLSNPEFLLGLLDARLIAGDTQVFDVVAGACPQSCGAGVTARSAARTRAAAARAIQRHAATSSNRTSSRHQAGCAMSPCSGTFARFARGPSVRGGRRSRGDRLVEAEDSPAPHPLGAAPAQAGRDVNLAHARAAGEVSPR